MSDKLETFIKNNKKQFDKFEAPEGLWDNIEQGLMRKATVQNLNNKRGKTGYILKIAASVSIIVMLGSVYRQYEKKPVVNISSINSDLAKQQIHYVSLIQKKAAS